MNRDTWDPEFKALFEALLARCEANNHSLATIRLAAAHNPRRYREIWVVLERAIDELKGVPSPTGEPERNAFVPLFVFDRVLKDNPVLYCPLAEKRIVDWVRSVIPWTTRKPWCRELADSWAKCFASCNRAVSAQISSLSSQLYGSMTLADALQESNLGEGSAADAGTSGKLFASRKEILEFDDLWLRLCGQVSSFTHGTSGRINVKIDPYIKAEQDSEAQRLNRGLLASHGPSRLGESVSTPFDVDEDYEPQYIAGATMKSLTGRTDSKPGGKRVARKRPRQG